MAESSEVVTKVMDNQDWIKDWDNQDIGFHKNCINPLLEKHVTSLIDGRSNITVFLPLCGKSVDLKWLADQGHTVTGVEVAQKAIEEFFEEQKIPFTSQPAPAVEGTLFQSENKKIQLYCCDFYKFSKEISGHFDAIWDRGGLIAINHQDRAKYVTIMKSLMAPGCRFLLSVVQYDETKYAGPPHHLGDETIQKLFEGSYTVKEIDDIDAIQEADISWGISTLREKVFLISPN